MTPEQFQSVKKIVVRLLCLAALTLGGYEAYEHLAVKATSQANAANSTVSPVSPQGPDVSFIVGSAHDCKNGGLLLNEGKFPNQTKTVYVEPTAKGNNAAANVIGKTCTVHGVALSTYHNAQRNTDTSEYHVSLPAQVEVK